MSYVDLHLHLLPGVDDDVVKEADKAFRKQGLDIRTGTRVTGSGLDGDAVFIEVEKESCAHGGVLVIDRK